jgi:CheY-like chemotaxis protein
VETAHSKNDAHVRRSLNSIRELTILGLEFVSFTVNRAPIYSLTRNTGTCQGGANLPFALVIEEPGDFRSSVMALLREHGWLAHGVSRAEEARRILIHIPYDLVVLDSELCGIDFSRYLQDSTERRALRVVVIASSRNSRLHTELAEHAAVLVKRSNLKEELAQLLGNPDWISQCSWMAGDTGMKIAEHVVID